jgi:hypothetical protein
LDAFESFVEWVGSVWDYVSNGYDWIQNKIVDAVLYFVPCEQLADKVTDDGEGVCKTLAKAALQAVAMAYGIPPEIPSWEATIAAYKGDLRAFIVENARLLPGVGVACDAATVADKVDSDADLRRSRRLRDEQGDRGARRRAQPRRPRRWQGWRCRRASSWSPTPRAHHSHRTSTSRSPGRTPRSRSGSPARSPGG